MDYPLSKEAASLFESIKHIDENGIEFWYGRELAPYLGYTQWRNFESVIEKAKDACKTATGATENDFADASKIGQNITSGRFAGFFGFFDDSFEVAPLSISEIWCEFAAIPEFNAIFVDVFDALE